VPLLLKRQCNRTLGVAPYLVLGLKNAVQFAVYEPSKPGMLTQGVQG
jgi:hypothetical protein